MRVRSNPTHSLPTELSTPHGGVGAPRTPTKPPSSSRPSGLLTSDALPRFAPGGANLMATTTRRSSLRPPVPAKPKQLQEEIAAELGPRQNSLPPPVPAKPKQLQEKIEAELGLLPNPWDSHPQSDSRPSVAPAQAGYARPPIAPAYESIPRPSTPSRHSSSSSSSSHSSSASIFSNLPSAHSSVTSLASTASSAPAGRPAAPPVPPKPSGYGKPQVSNASPKKPGFFKRLMNQVEDEINAFNKRHSKPKFHDSGAADHPENPFPRLTGGFGEGRFDRR
jgi:hypothetical protein